MVTITLAYSPTFICTDTTIYRNGKETYGTLAACSDGWYSFWGVTDGSAERDLSLYREELEQQRYLSVSDYFADIMNSINQGLNELSDYGHENIYGRKVRGSYIDKDFLRPEKVFGEVTTTINNDDIEELTFYADICFVNNCSREEYSCACHIIAPCGTCENGCGECQQQWHELTRENDFNGVRVVLVDDNDDTTRFLVVGTDDKDTAFYSMLYTMMYNNEYTVMMDDWDTITTRPVHLRPDWEKTPITQDITTVQGHDTVPAFIVEVPEL